MQVRLEDTGETLKEIYLSCSFIKMKFSICLLKDVVAMVAVDDGTPVQV